MSTADAVYVDQNVFDGGPPMRLQRSLGLVKPEQPHVVRQEILEQPDFSATTDYFAVAANVYEIRDLPFKARDLNSAATSCLSTVSDARSLPDTVSGRPQRPHQTPVLTCRVGTGSV